MTARSSKADYGIIYTFYSYKGGVGRSMALANCATLLAKWGFRVLMVDWDLEAPGLEKFFSSFPGVVDSRTRTPGILDLVQQWNGTKVIDWRDCRIRIPVANGSSALDLISAGRNDAGYSAKLHSLDFSILFREKRLGTYIEQLRDEWTESYDFVLVDSRTGVTDIGGICTVHLADVLVLLFTTTDSSLEGIRHIVERAREEHSKLPVDRAKLVAIPVPARDESRTEYEQSLRWKKRTAELFKPLYEDWLPVPVTAEDAVEVLRIPYIPYWSFGENLPVLAPDIKDPSSLGRAYEVLAKLISSRLDWAEVVATASALVRAPEPRVINPDWLSIQRTNSEKLASKLENGRDQKGGYLESYYYLTNTQLNLSQKDLLKAAEFAQAPNHGWPVGIVLHNEDSPQPMEFGIQAEILQQDEVDFWSTNSYGDFYAFRSPLERDSIDSVFFQIRIARVAELLAHCHRFYFHCGRFASDEVRFSLTHSGFGGLALDGQESGRAWFFRKTKARENKVSSSVTFTLGELEENFNHFVMKLCNEFFVLFDFREFPIEVYERNSRPFSNLTPIKRP